MEIFNIHVENFLAMLNGITAFSVLQSLIFTYWCQTNEFKDNLKSGGQWWAAGFLILFTALYCVAIRVINRDYVDMLTTLPKMPTNEVRSSDPTKISMKEILIRDAQRYRNFRIYAVCIFNVIALLAILKYLPGNY